MIYLKIRSNRTFTAELDIRPNPIGGISSEASGIWAGASASRGFVAIITCVSIDIINLSL